MPKKALGVWILSSMTAAAIAHVIDALNALLFNNPAVLLRLYPFAADKLEAVTSTAYFLTFAFITFILWGLTCAVVFENPVEAFLNKILSDAKKQSTAENQLLERKSELLDAMNETVEMNSELLAQVKDVIYNIRAEVKEIRPLKESIEKVKAEISRLKKELKSPSLCVTCRRPMLPDFNVCPYCGEDLKPVAEEIAPLRKYK